MAEVKLADIINKQLFTDYVIDRTAEKVNLLSGGAIVGSDQLNKLITGGGNVLTMRDWNDLDGDDEVMHEGRALEIAGITTKAEKASVLIRAKAWGATQLSGALTGEDPLNVIAELASDWWVRKEQQILLSTLKGVFECEGMAEHVLDISKLKGTEAIINGDAVIDAKQKLGDNADILKMLFMHSATFSALQKEKMIEYIQVPNSTIQIPTYLGYRVVVNDNLPVAESTGKVYTTYLLAQGAISRGDGVPSTLKPVSVDEDSLKSVDYLVNRRALVMHPNGLSWTSASVAEETPSNTELGTGTNWEVKKDLKKIGLVKLIHRVAPSVGA